MWTWREIWPYIQKIIEFVINVSLPERWKKLNYVFKTILNLKLCTSENLQHNVKTHHSGLPSTTHHILKLRTKLPENFHRGFAIKDPKKSNRFVTHAFDVILGTIF